MRVRPVSNAFNKIDLTDDEVEKEEGIMCKDENNQRLFIEKNLDDPFYCDKKKRETATTEDIKALQQQLDDANTMLNPDCTSQQRSEAQQRNINRETTKRHGQYIRYRGSLIADKDKMTRFDQN